MTQYQNSFLYVKACCSATRYIGPITFVFTSSVYSKRQILTD